jgi:hypothetical protein
LANVNVVLANKFMADRLFQILPDPGYKDWAHNHAPNTLMLGALVEAAVAAVNDVEAVDDLME